MTTKPCLLCEILPGFKSSAEIDGVLPEEVGFLFGVIISYGFGDEIVAHVVRSFCERHAKLALKMNDSGMRAALDSLGVRQKEATS